VLEKDGGWSGGISNDFETISNRYGGECMHDAFPLILGLTFIASNNVRKDGSRRWDWM
jgi:hypothetical protein